MKIILYRLLLVILITAGMTVCIHAGTKKEAHIEFNEEVYDFGEVSVVNGNVSHEFIFVNSGNKNLTITDATADCGCTKPEYSEEPVGPGKSGKVKVTFVPNGRGHFSKKVTIRTNGKPRKIHLIIKGTVVP